MISRPDVRHAVMVGVSSYVLSIPDDRSSLIFIVLNKLHNLINRWEDVQKKQAPKPGEAAPEPKPEELRERKVIVHKIEAIALVFLCCPYTKIRKLSIELLQSIRAADRVNKAGTIDDVRVMDIIDESGPDVINRLRQDARYIVLLDNTDSSVEALACSSKTSAEAQTRWTFCFGELLKYLLAFSPGNFTADRNTNWIRVSSACMGYGLCQSKRRCP
jgi:hypothetical protein